MRYFITGTDTGVGKTVATAALAAACDGPVAALKPLASGVKIGTQGDDAELLGVATGTRPEVHMAWRLPLSPHRAALHAGKHARLDETVAWIRMREQETTFVEGVGGWRVPISTRDEGFWIQDLAQALDWPVLIVAANRLGVLNHTLLTVDAVRRAGLEVAAVVLNHAWPAGPEDGPARIRNREDLELLLDGVPLLELNVVPILERRFLRMAGQPLISRLRS